MTLKARNRIFQFFLYISFASLIISLTVFFLTLARGTLAPLPSFRLPAFMSKLSFAKQNIVPTFISLFFLGLYVPVVYFIFSDILKTHSHLKLSSFQHFYLEFSAKRQDFIQYVLMSGKLLQTF